MLTDKTESPFESPPGEKVYSEILSTVKKYGMDSLISSGVLLGLSGGADSVLLAHFLDCYKARNNADFPVVAVHINHCIRGDEANRDEEFSRRLASSLGFEFQSYRLDVPSIAKELGLGIEETARNVRYDKFQEIISGRSDLSVIAVAHNSTDNAETIIFNISRGSGLVGASGIAPIRDNIIRPLIEVSKNKISSLLDESGIEYVSDSTNESDQYSRNYIRHNILPSFSRINPIYEESLYSFGESLREATVFIDQTVFPFCVKYEETGYLLLSEISTLHPAQLSRLIILLARMSGVKSIEKKQISAIKELISGDNFKVSLSSGKLFIAERGKCRFADCDDISFSLPEIRLNSGENPIPNTDGIIFVGECHDSSSNVYKFSIQADLSSAIIVGDLYCRARSAGDSYFFGGMTHKLKKVFNDRGIPPSIRSRIPVICDDKGIVWVPGLPVRDDYGDGTRGETLPISFKTLADSSDIKLYSASYDALE